MNTRLVLNHSYEEASRKFGVEEDLKDLFAEQIPGLAGDSTAYPRCNTADFLTSPTSTKPSTPKPSATKTPTRSAPSSPASRTCSSTRRY